ncbi:hypothetical protein [Nocardia stercoris]|uniref:Uncharacterized protein n=1 Tax=Nocardia stercoris TaxID=2483361 RepID=A0A3M2L1E6_9NOCA|nr:hypothetical protein [Nocardia stercoris]RMI31391.1 hypothetical protein EBN03_18730 [Nocardia stercoris]
MDHIAPEDARAALDAVERARAGVAGEVGLPRWYWWVLAVGWIGIGLIGVFGLAWLTAIATLVFGAVHSYIASKLLNGRRRTSQLQVSAEVAGTRIPIVVIGMLLVLVALTVAAAFALGADGARHPGVGAAVLVAAIVGFGGPEILRVLRGWARA